MKKKILLFGGDGYLGWPIAMYLANKGHSVTICDNFNKRKWELEIGVKPLIPISTLHERVSLWNKNQKESIFLKIGDVTNQRFVYDLFSTKPDVIIHGADQPSSPFSMKGINTAQVTQYNNVASGLNILFAIKKYCPSANYIRIGANALVDYRSSDGKNVGPPCSYYELSRLNDCNNIFFAVTNWKLTANIVNTGVVYNDQTKETMLSSKLRTSFHYDRVFGTIVNRFCVQAVSGMDLTVYGDGNQKCALSSLESAVENIAQIAERDPVKKGKFEIINRFEAVKTVNDISGEVIDAASNLGIKIDCQSINNPRMEMVGERNQSIARYELNDKSNGLKDIDELLRKIVEHKNNILPYTIMPIIKWIYD